MKRFFKKLSIFLIAVIIISTVPEKPLPPESEIAEIMDDEPQPQPPSAPIRKE